MEFKIQGIEDFEKEYAREGNVKCAHGRWSDFSDETSNSEKDVDVAPVEKWRQKTHYAFKPVVFRSSGTSYLDYVRSFLLKSFLDAEKLLAFKGDPEDESFVPISDKTIDRAVRLLTPYVTLFSTAKYSIRVLPGPDGSVDVHWKNPARELLINIPADLNEPASFYGDDYGKFSIKGKMDTSSLHPSVLMWLLIS